MIRLKFQIKIRKPLISVGSVDASTISGAEDSNANRGKKGSSVFLNVGMD